MTPAGSFVIREGGLGDPQVEALLAHHRAEARASTPSENAHALDSRGLASADITLFACWDGNDLAGVCAIRALGDGQAELKSMRTAPGHLRRGVARLLLDHVVAVARARGIARLSLETGTAAMFAPANAFYERYGFVDCSAFGGYPPSPHNRFMTMTLDLPPPGLDLPA